MIIIIILIASITRNVPDDCRLDRSKSMYVSYLFDEYPTTLPALLLQNINVATFSFKNIFYSCLSLSMLMYYPEIFRSMMENIKYTFSSNFHFLKRKVNWLIKFWHWLEILDVATLMSSQQNRIYNTTHSYLYIKTKLFVCQYIYIKLNDTLFFFGFLSFISRTLCCV